MKTKTTTKTKYHSLSRRIVAQFCIFTLILSTIYGAFCFLLLYTLEDSFIEREVKLEADYLRDGYQKTSSWPTPSNDYMTLYFSIADLPDEIRIRFLEEPKRKEFFGEQGRHYHLYALPEQNNVYLVSEVSQMLMVRPISGAVLKFLLICGGILVLISFIIAWRLGRKTAKPLQKLSDLVDGVAPENIPDSFAQQYPNNEIGILARTLEDSMSRIKQALVREKSFTRDVSHELRTPVAIIKNAVEVYQQSELSQTQSDNLVNRIAQASQQMEQTVTTLLVLAREEHTSMNKETIKLLPLVEQSIIDHSHLLQGKQVEVMVDDNCNAQVLVQQGMLKVLLDNLLSNAFQYTEVGQVKVCFEQGQLIISDTGPGIEAQISNKVTEPAVKGSQSTGYGFGLSIVKRLCEHQGWQLTVKSDQGTCISVSLE